MSEYVKTCSFCGKEIKMSDELGKWPPFNKDGTPHDCRKQQETKQEQQEFTLEAVQKKLASIGITLDLDKLMNSK